MKSCFLLSSSTLLSKSEICTAKPYPRVFGASDGDLVLKCVDSNTNEFFMGGYTTSNNLTGRGSNS